VLKLFRPERDVKARLRMVMTKAFDDVSDLASREKVSIKTAAYILAIDG